MRYVRLQGGLAHEQGRGDVKAQTEQVLKNLSAVLAAAGTSMDRAVKATVFLKKR